MTASRFAALGVAAALLAGAAAFADPVPYDPEETIPAEPYHVRGWLEHARLDPRGLLLDAKLDPGARTSSLQAEILTGSDMLDGMLHGSTGEDEEDESEETEEGDEEDLDIDHSEVIDDDEPYVVFRVTNESGYSRTLRRRILRWVEIKRHGDATQRRPVVHLGFCVAGLWLEGDVNLADREGFNYPLLIGRTMLSDADILVDSREIYTYRSSCDRPDEDD